MLGSLAAELSDWRLTVVAPHAPGDQEHDRRLSYRVLRARSFGRGAGIRQLMPGLAARSVAAALIERPDILLCGHPALSPIGLILRRGRGIPYLVFTYAMELRHPKIQSLLRHALAPASRILTISSFGGNEVRRLGVQEERIRQLSLGFEGSRFRAVRSEPPASAESLQGRRWLLTVARLDERYKGIDTVIKALPLIAAQVPDVQYAIAGDGWLRPYLERTAARVGCQDRVHFLGRVTDGQLAALYAECTSFVMVSRDRMVDGGAEGFGLVYLEANSFGKPVIGGRSGGVPDAVDDGVTGLLADPLDVASVAEQAIRLLKDPALARRLGEQGRKRVLEERTWRATAAELRSVVEECLDQATRELSERPQEQTSAGPKPPASARSPDRVLLATLLPTEGGVPTMAGQVVRFLRRGGYQVSLAYYLPYSQAPELSVPSWQLLWSRPRARRGVGFGDVPAHELGVRLPELEWAWYLPSREWRRAIAEHDIHMVVSGNALPALPILRVGRPCLAWVATPYLADKADRLRCYPWQRQLLERLCGTPVSLYLEAQCVRRARILALSEYTARELATLAPQAKISRMPMPIDASLFAPEERPVRSGALGFAGRYNDPRKNPGLLLAALGICRQRGADLSLHLIGAEPEPSLRAQVDTAGLRGHVHFHPYRERSALKGFYHSLEVFVMPSRQEGLGIVGLEAMACGRPVVSTRCGGPEEYVRDGRNGFLVGFDPEEMAAAILRLTEDPELWARCSEGALRTVLDEYSEAAVERLFWDAFEETYGQSRRS